MSHAQSFLWAPVFLAIGIGIYFSLPVEPSAAWTLCGVLAVCLLLVTLKSRVFLVFLLVGAGFGAAQLRTAFVYTPILQKDIGPTEITAQIEEIEYLAGGKGIRFLLSGLAGEKFIAGQIPRKARVTYRGGEDDIYRVGDHIRALVKLSAPSTPVIPGGFDFQRYLYFKGIGAVGFIYRAPEVIAQGQGSVIEGLRQKISRNINQVMEPRYAGVATALLTGYRGGITEGDQEAFRAAGLAHLLAISGLHVGLFSGFVFFMVRLALAVIPTFALKYPIKKYAAVAAFVAAFFYMLLAGATVPTQRAVLMSGVFFLAIILDRSPISMRLVAFAAFIILLLFPESLMSASFQLSFAAVAGLVFFYEKTRGFWMRVYRSPGIMRRVGLYFFGVCVTSIVATLATAPFALYHFHRMAVYGLLANLIAVPVTSLMIMPMAFLALLLMPFGGEFVPLYLMEWGIHAVLDIAHYVESLPHSVWYIPAVPTLTMLLFVGAALFIMIAQGRWKWIAACFLLALPVSFIGFKRPDILITQDFATMFYQDEQGALHISSRRKNRFALENWETYFGHEEGSSRYWPKEAARDDGAMHCDEDACRLELKGQKISFMGNAEDISAECAWGDAVIVADPVRKAWELCDLDRVVLLDKFDGLDDGAHALYVSDAGVRVETSEGLRGMRPWNARYLQDFHRKYARNDNE